MRRSALYLLPTVIRFIMKKGFRSLDWNTLKRIRIPRMGGITVSMREQNLMKTGILSQMAAECWELRQKAPI